MNLELKLNPIGYVRIKSGKKNKREKISEIVLDKKCVDGLQCFSNFTQAIIVYYLDKESAEIETPSQEKPLNRKEKLLNKIFPKKAEEKPNNIGMVIVDILSVNRNIMAVKGLDAANDTPIIDIKPHYATNDSETNIEAVWEKRLKEYYI